MTSFLHNNFNLVKLFAVLLLGIGFLALGITLPVTIDNLQYRDSFFGRSGEGCIFLLGIGFIISGISLLIKQKWGRPLATIVLLLSMIFWFLFIQNEYIPQREMLMVYGFSSALWIFLFCGILFINNKKVIEEFDREDLTDQKYNDDILDFE